MKGVGARVPGWQGGRVADGRRHANGVGLVKPGGFGVWAQLLLLLLQPSCECSYCSSQFPTGAGPLVPMAWHT